MLYTLHLLAEGLALHGQHYLGQWLANTQVTLLAEREAHGADALCQLHAFLKGFVYHLFVYLGESHMVYRLGCDAVGDVVQVLEHTFAEEGGDRRHQACQRL